MIWRYSFHKPSSILEVNNTTAQIVHVSRGHSSSVIPELNQNNLWISAIPHRLIDSAIPTSLSCQSPVSGLNRNRSSPQEAVQWGCHDKMRKYWHFSPLSLRIEVASGTKLTIWYFQCLYTLVLENRTSPHMTHPAPLLPVSGASGRNSHQ